MRFLWSGTQAAVLNEFTSLSGWFGRSHCSLQPIPEDLSRHLQLITLCTACAQGALHDCDESLRCRPGNVLALGTRADTKRLLGDLQVTRGEPLHVP